MSLNAIQPYGSIPEVAYEQKPESTLVLDTLKPWWTAHGQMANEHGLKTVCLLVGKAILYSSELEETGLPSEETRLVSLQEEFDGLHRNYQELIGFASSLKTAGEYITSLLEEEKLRNINIKGVVTREPTATPEEAVIEATEIQEPSELETLLAAQKDEIARLMTAVSIGNSVFFKSLSTVNETLETIRYQLEHGGKLPQAESEKPLQEIEIENRAPVVSFTCCWGGYTSYKKV